MRVFRMSDPKHVEISQQSLVVIGIDPDRIAIDFRVVFGKFLNNRSFSRTGSACDHHHLFGPCMQWQALKSSFVKDGGYFFRIVIPGQLKRLISGALSDIIYDIFEIFLIIRASSQNPALTYTWAINSCRTIRCGDKPPSASKNRVKEFSPPGNSVFML